MLAEPDTVEVEALSGLRYAERPALNGGRTQFGPGERLRMLTPHARRRIAQGLCLGLEGAYLKSSRVWAPEGMFPRVAPEAWILATGPSLRETVGRVPADAVVWCVNDAQHAPPPHGRVRLEPGAPWPLAGVPLTYWVTADPWEAEHNVPVGGPYLRRFVRYDQRALAAGRTDVTLYPGRLDQGGFGLSLDWEHGAYLAPGSTYAAMQLALMGGTRHLHLLGLDLGWADGASSHFHGPKHRVGGKYARQVIGFRRALRCLRELGITWTNHSPVSQEALAV